jgi:hypothetical protein
VRLLVHEAYEREEQPRHDSVGEHLEDRAVESGYGYFTNNDETHGGHDDYTAHLVWASMQYRF